MEMVFEQEPELKQNFDGGHGEHLADMRVANMGAFVPFKIWAVIDQNEGNERRQNVNEISTLKKEVFPVTRFKILDVLARTEDCAWLYDDDNITPVSELISDKLEVNKEAVSRRIYELRQMGAIATKLQQSDSKSAFSIINIRLTQAGKEYLYTLEENHSAKIAEIRRPEVIESILQEVNYARKQLGKQPEPDLSLADLTPKQLKSLVRKLSLELDTLIDQIDSMNGRIAA